MQKFVINDEIRGRKTQKKEFLWIKSIYFDQRITKLTKRIHKYVNEAMPALVITYQRILLFAFKIVTNTKS